jgi:hypothetical protein
LGIAAQRRSITGHRRMSSKDRKYRQLRVFDVAAAGATTRLV